MKISTGFKSIDKQLGLLETKKIIMVAARPQMSKATTAKIQIQKA